MSIHIDQSSCVGCRSCVEVCPGNLIHINSEHKAEIKRPEDCWGCASCLKECRFNAVAYYLGADVGGRGALMRVHTEGDLSHWIITKPNSESITITVDRKQANKY
ncbi:MAG: ferredoxin family protein [Planctomycetia bacterium]|nr:ferredoxin family protein [Planctomycetia bacterium]